MPPRDTYGAPTPDEVASYQEQMNNRALVNSFQNARGGSGASVGSFQSLRFPEDVGTENVPVYVRFEPKEVIFGGISSEGSNRIFNSGGSVFANNSGTSVTGTRVSSGNNIFSPTLNASLGPFNVSIRNPIGGLVDSLISGAENAISRLTNGLVTANITTSLGVLNRSVTGRVDASGAISVSQNIRVNPNSSFTTGSINLFLPHNLSTLSSVDYGPVEFGGAGQQLLSNAEAALNSGGLGNLMSNASGQGIGQALSGIFAGVMADYARSNDKLRGGLAILEGIVANNFSYQIFNKVKHRNFDYTFKMIAKNENESTEIKRICDMFLFYMLPTRLDGPFSFYEIPCMWEIQYMMGSNPLQFHQQPKNCFLTDVIVKYGGESKSAVYNNGAPLEVELTVKFVEIEPLYRDGGRSVAGSSGTTDVIPETSDIVDQPSTPRAAAYEDAYVTNPNEVIGPQ